MTSDPERLAELAARFLPPKVRDDPRAAAVAGRYAAAFSGLRYGAKSEEAAQRSRERVLAGLDRLEAELDGREYLAGDRFSVPDLTAAALFYPLVLPPEGPSLGEVPGGFERFRASLTERPGFRWVADMYRRHRLP